MAANKELLQKRYARIRDKFDKMSAALSPNGRRVNTYANIIETLANEYCYSEKTIERICSNRQGNT